MIELASGFYKSYLVSPEISILMIGLDGSGKTTLLERVKVTEFKGPGSSSGTQILWNNKPFVKENIALSDPKDSSDTFTDISTTRRRRKFLSLGCPAPKLYRNMDADKEEYFQEESSTMDTVLSHGPTNSCTDEIHDFVSTHGNSKRSNSINHNHHSENESFMQYDMKKDKTMFPLHLIRPTVGMNLGKIEACSAKIKIFDLGGSLKMIPLWERYYKDIDAVVYVLDVSPTAKVTKLMESRAFFRCMRDDEAIAKVPVMIFANKTDARISSRSNAKKNKEDESFDNNTLNDTSLLDVAEMFLSSPRGSLSNDKKVDEDPSTHDISMFAGSAKTGEGVRVAFEWVIQKAISCKL